VSAGNPSDHRPSTLWIVGVICVAVFALAFVVAPKSCEGGLTIYFWSGVAAIVALFIVPVALRTDLSGLKRVAFGIGFSVLGAATWIGGLFASNMQILCRLF
jgi:hypothetical protein